MRCYRPSEPPTANNATPTPASHPHHGTEDSEKLEDAGWTGAGELDPTGVDGTIAPPTLFSTGPPFCAGKFIGCAMTGLATGVVDAGAT